MDQLSVGGINPDMIEMICQVVRIPDMLDDDGCGYDAHEIAEVIEVLYSALGALNTPSKEGDDALSVSDDEFEDLLSSMFRDGGAEVE